jgi:hypothetical protein
MILRGLRILEKPEAPGRRSHHRGDSEAPGNITRQQACHPSVILEKDQCCEASGWRPLRRGDSEAVNFLFRRFPDKDPQWLTEHKICGNGKRVTHILDGSALWGSREAFNRRTQPNHSTRA